MNVKIENLTKIYPAEEKKNLKETIAVSDFNLDIKDGELIALLGPSGCGKSTVLSMLAGLKDITKGRIFFGDEDVTELQTEKRNIGLVFQNYALYPHMSIYKNVAFPLTNIKIETYKKDFTLIRWSNIVKILSNYQALSELANLLNNENKINKSEFIFHMVMKFNVDSKTAKELFSSGISLNLDNKEFINGLIEKYKDKINERINKINKKGCKINEKFEILINDKRVKEARKLNKAEIDEMVYEVSKVVQIAEYLYRKPCELSGGQQQRVAIARALVKKPKLLLLDEPLSNLDARLRISTREEIRRIQKETGITTVFVTHDQDEANAISDRIVVMNNGKIIEVGKPDDVYQNPHNLFSAKFIGLPEINIIKGFIKNNGIYIGDILIKKLNEAVNDKEIYVGIRSEDFIKSDDCTGIRYVEHKKILKGREEEYIGLLKDSINGKITITGFLNKLKDGDLLKVKDDYLFIFDSKTEERLYLN